MTTTGAAPCTAIPAPLVAELLAATGDVPTYDLYQSGWGAAVYDAMTRADTGETNELLRLLRGPALDVLELACGSGRLTLPMLTRGHRVTALDNAQPMLDALAARLTTGRAAALATRLTPVHGDMASFSLGRTYDAVVLGATSVTLLDAAQRRSMLADARRHLHEDGRLLISAVDLDGWGSDRSRTTATMLDVEGQPVLCVVVEHRDVAMCRRDVSILTLMAGPQGLTDPRIVLSSPGLVPASTLADEVVAAGFQPPTVHEVGASLGSAAIVMLECRR